MGHTVGFLTNWLPGRRLSGTGAATRAWPQQKAVTAWAASAELCLLAPQLPKVQVPPTTAIFPKTFKGKLQQQAPGLQAVL